MALTKAFVVKTKPCEYCRFVLDNYTCDRCTNNNLWRASDDIDTRITLINESGYKALSEYLDKMRVEK